MSKLFIAAVVTTTVAAGGLLVANALRGSNAHAKADAKTAPTASAGDEPCLADFIKGAGGKKSATDRASTGALRAGAGPSLTGSGTNATQATDCVTVGKHLAELEADATHGPEHRPDEATCEKCASVYTSRCETQNWSVARRTCTLAAADLLNAHLCAGAQGAPAADVPPQLQCSALAQHIATTVQAGGLYTEVTDMAQQVDSACELGGWSTELRQCFAAAQSIPALQACVAPTEHE